jgi:hypothetical protein
MALNGYVSDLQARCRVMKSRPPTDFLHVQTLGETRGVPEYVESWPEGFLI